MTVEIGLEDLIELDEDAAPLVNAERCRQQAEFHAREVVDLSATIQAARTGVSRENWPKDPRLEERQQHQRLEMICRELVAAFDWLTSKTRPSADLSRALEEVRTGYDRSPEIALLREIAETTYPLLTTITLSRLNGVGLISETKLSLKHAARGRALSDSMDADEAATLVNQWLTRAVAIQASPLVHISMIRQSIDWLSLLSKQRSNEPETRILEDDLETIIYLARQALDEGEFPYRVEEGP